MKSLASLIVMLPTIIIPDVRGGVIRPQQTREEFLRRWHEDYEAGREAIAPPQNIRFEHDPDWRFHAMSMEFIRAVNDGHVPLDRPAALFWSAVGGLFMIGSALLNMMRFR